MRTWWTSSACGHARSRSSRVRVLAGSEIDVGCGCGAGGAAPAGSAAAGTGTCMWRPATHMSLPLPTLRVCSPPAVQDCAAAWLHTRSPHQPGAFTRMHAQVASAQQGLPGGAPSSGGQSSASHLLICPPLVPFSPAGGRRLPVPGVPPGLQALPAHRLLRCAAGQAAAGWRVVRGWCSSLLAVAWGLPLAPAMQVQPVACAGTSMQACPPTAPHLLPTSHPCAHLPTDQRFHAGSRVPAAGQAAARHRAPHVCQVSGRRGWCRAGVWHVMMARCTADGMPRGRCCAMAPSAGSAPSLQQSW